MSTSPTLGSVLRFKQPEHDRLAREIAAFEAAGGVIQRFAPGETAETIARRSGQPKPSPMRGRGS